MFTPIESATHLSQKDKEECLIYLEKIGFSEKQIDKFIKLNTDDNYRALQLSVHNLIHLRDTVVLEKQAYFTIADIASILFLYADCANKKKVPLHITFDIMVKYYPGFLAIGCSKDQFLMMLRHVKTYQDVNLIFFNIKSIQAIIEKDFDSDPIKKGLWQSQFDSSKLINNIIKFPYFNTNLTLIIENFSMLSGMFSPYDLYEYAIKGKTLIQEIINLRQEKPLMVRKCAQKTKYIPESELENFLNEIGYTNEQAKKLISALSYDTVNELIQKTKKICECLSGENQFCHNDLAYIFLTRNSKKLKDKEKDIKLIGALLEYADILLNLQFKKENIIRIAACNYGARKINVIANQYPILQEKISKLDSHEQAIFKAFIAPDNITHKISLVEGEKIITILNQYLVTLIEIGLSANFIKEKASTENGRPILSNIAKNADFLKVFNEEEINKLIWICKKHPKKTSGFSPNVFNDLIKYIQDSKVDLAIIKKNIDLIDQKDNSIYGALVQKLFLPILGENSENNLSLIQKEYVLQTEYANGSDLQIVDYTELLRKKSQPDEITHLKKLLETINQSVLKEEDKLFLDDLAQIILSKDKSKTYRERLDLINFLEIRYDQILSRGFNKKQIIEIASHLQGLKKLKAIDDHYFLLKKEIENLEQYAFAIDLVSVLPSRDFKTIQSNTLYLDKQARCGYVRAIDCEIKKIDFPLWIDLSNWHEVLLFTSSLGQTYLFSHHDKAMLEALCMPENMTKIICATYGNKNLVSLKESLSYFIRLNMPFAFVTKSIFFPANKIYYIFDAIKDEFNFTVLHNLCLTGNQIIKLIQSFKSLKSFNEFIKDLHSILMKSHFFEISDIKQFIVFLIEDKNHEHNFTDDKARKLLFSSVCKKGMDSFFNDTHFEETKYVTNVFPSSDVPSEIEKMDVCIESDIMKSYEILLDTEKHIRLLKPKLTETQLESLVIKLAMINESIKNESDRLSLDDLAKIIIGKDAFNIQIKKRMKIIDFLDKRYVDILKLGFSKSQVICIASCLNGFSKLSAIDKFFLSLQKEIENLEVCALTIESISKLPIDDFNELDKGVIYLDEKAHCCYVCNICFAVEKIDFPLGMDLSDLSAIISFVSKKVNTYQFLQQDKLRLKSIFSPESIAKIICASKRESTLSAIEGTLSFLIQLHVPIEMIEEKLLSAPKKSCRFFNSIKSHATMLRILNFTGEKLINFIAFFNKAQDFSEFMKDISDYFFKKNNWEANIIRDFIVRLMEKKDRFYEFIDSESRKKLFFSVCEEGVENFLNRTTDENRGIDINELPFFLKDVSTPKRRKREDAMRNNNTQEPSSSVSLPVLNTPINQVGLFSPNTPDLTEILSLPFDEPSFNNFEQEINELYQLNTNKP